MTDGRIYPVLEDRVSVLASNPNVRKLISKGHFTFIGNNSSIEIQLKNGTVILKKAGRDKRNVWEI